MTPFLQIMRTVDNKRERISGSTIAVLAQSIIQDILFAPHGVMQLAGFAGRVLYNKQGVAKLCW